MLDNPDQTFKPRQPKENLPLNPSLFFGRIRIPNDPIVAFRSYFLTEADLKFENSSNYESRPPIALSINNFNLQAEATDYIEREALQDTMAGLVAQHMPKDSKLGFYIIADVNDNDMPLPRVMERSGVLAGRYRSHAIKVMTDKEKGYKLECDSLTDEQINFSLNLLIRTLGFSLEKAGKGRDVYSIEKVSGKPEDGLVYDHCFVTASDEDLQRDLARESDREKYGKFRNQKTAQLKYLKMTLEEILAKRKGN